MNFNKDILLIDLEMTGLDFRNNEIIQLSAILLDKKTLKEKAWFNSYVKPRNWKSRDPESMKINGLKWEILKEAADLKPVLVSFIKKFKPNQVILANYGGIMDITFLQEAFKKSKMKWPFDYHIFNLWPVFFQYLAQKNQLRNSKKFTGFTLEDLMKRFGISSENRHDGLSDCRVEAEVLRRIVKSK